MFKKMLLFSLLFTAAIFIFGIRIYRLSLSSNGAMEGTLTNHDLLLANRLIYFISKPSRNDMVVYADPHVLSNNPILQYAQLYIYGSVDRPSRVIAVPGDYIQGTIENDTLILHLKKPYDEALSTLHEPYVAQTHMAAQATDAFEYHLHQDEYWLMSDNRHNATRDSRSFGPIPGKYITGKIIAKLN